MGWSSMYLSFVSGGISACRATCSKKSFPVPVKSCSSPRGSDYHGVVLSDAVIIAHYFNKTVCHTKNCILSFLYTHKPVKPQPGKSYFYSKLTVCGQLAHIMAMEMLYAYLTARRRALNREAEEILLIFPQ